MTSIKRIEGQDEKNTTASPQQRILQAALAEFASRGLAGARVDEIARRAGVNKQALYYYFGSKNGLFQASLTFGYGQGLTGLEIDDLLSLPPVQAMRELIGTIFDHFRTTPHIVEIIAHENHHRGEHLTPEVKTQMREAVAPIFNAITTILSRGQEAGALAPEVDATQFYLTVIATCMFYFANAFTLSAILDRDLLGDGLIAQRRRHLQDILVAGLTVQPNG